MRLLRKINSILTPGNSLKKKVVVGSFWLYALEGFSNGLTIVQTIILARLLAPEHFGIIGVFFIFSAAIEGFTKTGFSKALVQRKDIDNDFLDTAWTISIVRGILLFLLVILASPLIVTFFNTPRALPVIRVLGVSLLLKGFHNIGTVYFSRKLEFHKQFLWKINGFLANFLISIPLAFVLRNEWAIVWGLLAADSVTLILSFLLHSYRPRLQFDFEIFRVLFNYGKWLLFSSILVFFASQGDKVFLTKLLGEVELGIYVIALRFARIPEFLTKQVKNVLFPAYSKFQEDPIATKDIYLKTLNIITLFCVPLAGGIVVLAKPFVSIFLGDRWLPSAVPMQILTIAAAVNVITISGMSLANALGKPSFTFKINAVWLITLCVFIYPLAYFYGVVGVSLCYLVRSLVGFIVWKLDVNRMLKITAGNLICVIFPIFGTLMFMTMIYHFNQFVPITSVFSFITAIGIGIAVYFFLGLVMNKFTRLKVYQGLVEVVHLWKTDKLKKQVDSQIERNGSISEYCAT